MLRSFKLNLLRSCFYAFIWHGNCFGHFSKILGVFGSNKPRFETASLGQNADEITFEKVAQNVAVSLG